MTTKFFKKTHLRLLTLALGAFSTILALGALTARAQPPLRPSPTPIQSAVEPCHIRIRKVPEDDPRNAYPLALLKMAIAKTEAQYGPCTIDMLDTGTESRNFRLVMQKELDVIWNAGTVAREKVLKAVYVPLFQGLHGYRILIIRKGEESRFAKVKSIEDLRRLKAGQVQDWQSTEILVANRLPVETSDNFEDMFTMLAKGRFDYFPRALHEPLHELKQHAQLPLTIEPKLLLHYVVADYFFVHPEAGTLAERLRLGLERGVADGTRDKIRNEKLGFAALLRRLKLTNRRVIELENPDLPPGTPQNRPEFWLQLGAKKTENSVHPSK